MLHVGGGGGRASICPVSKRYNALGTTAYGSRIVQGACSSSSRKAVHRPRSLDTNLILSQRIADPTRTWLEHTLLAVYPPSRMFMPLAVNLPTVPAVWTAGFKLRDIVVFIRHDLPLYKILRLQLQNQSLQGKQ